MRKWTVKIQEQDKQRDLPWSVWVPSLYEFACNLSHPSFLWVMQQVQPLWSPKNSKGKGMISRESLQWLLSHVTLGLQVEGCPGALCLEPVFPDWQASNLAPTLSNSWAGRKLQKMLQAFPLLKVLMRAFFMVQWLRIHLPMQGTWVWSLFQDPTCPGASKPVCHNYWVPFPRAHAPQQEEQWEAWALQLEKACVQQQRPRTAQREKKKSINDVSTLKICRWLCKWTPSPQLCPQWCFLRPTWLHSSWAISNPKRWCCESAALSMPANLENSAVATGLEKVRFHCNPKERQYERMLKLPHNCSHLTLLKILQARIQKYMNHELPDAQAVFRKDRGTRDQIANICWIIEKARELQKNIYFCFIDYAKVFVWITINWKTLKEMGIPYHLTSLLRNLYAGQEATVKTGCGTTG